MVYVTFGWFHQEVFLMSLADGSDNKNKGEFSTRSESSKTERASYE